MERLFVDTGAWYAFVNRRDPDHLRVVEALEAFAGRLLTTNFVFDETVTLCLYRLGHQVAERVGRTLLDPRIVDAVRINPDDERAAWELFLERPDKSYGFTDCTSFALLRRLRLERVAALDDDFRREGFVSIL
jgi:predicted nucleic acid-binding protein